MVVVLFNYDNDIVMFQAGTWKTERVLSTAQVNIIALFTWYIAVPVSLLE